MLPLAHLGFVSVGFDVRLPDSDIRKGNEVGRNASARAANAEKRKPPQGFEHLRGTVTHSTHERFTGDDMILHHSAAFSIARRGQHAKS